MNTSDHIPEHPETPERAVKSEAFRNRLTIAVIVLFLVLASIRIASTWRIFSDTVDEAAHIATGMELLDQGSYTLELLHPPLARVAVAAGPWILGSRYGGERWLWTEGNRILHDGDDYLTNLAAARAGTLPFFVLAAGAVAAWAWWIFGRVASMIAVGLFTTDPTTLAHAGLATTDMAAGAGVALAMLVFARWLERPRMFDGAILGIAVGVAVASKFTAILFIVVVFAAFAIWKALIDRRTVILSEGGGSGVSEGSAIGNCRRTQILRSPPSQDDGRMATRRRAGSAAIALAVCGLVVWGSYCFSTGTIEDRANRAKVQLDELFEWLPASLRTVAVRAPLPAPEFPLGVEIFRENNEIGRKSYLFGEISHDSWPYYFPVAVGLKTPLPFLALSLLAIVVAVRRYRRDWRVALPIVAVIMIFVSLIPARAGLGVRHVLVIYPLLAISAGAAGAMLLRSRRRVAQIAVVALLLWQGAESAVSHPDYLPYFNQLAGSRPERLLTDSNLDWGQDLLRLQEELRRRKIESFWFKYHGGASVELFDLPHHQLLPRNFPVNGWIAISRTSMTGVIEVPRSFSWLERYEPVTVVGKGILLYYIDDVPPIGELEIRGLHPGATTAGVGFNIQPNGSSALGVESAEATPSTVIVFDGRELPTAFGGPQSLSAEIAAAVYERPGRHTVELRDGERRSDVLEFVVEP